MKNFVREENYLHAGGGAVSTMHGQTVEVVGEYEYPDTMTESPKEAQHLRGQQGHPQDFIIFSLRASTPSLSSAGFTLSARSTEPIFTTQ